MYDEFQSFTTRFPRTIEKALTQIKLAPHHRLPRRRVCDGCAELNLILREMFFLHQLKLFLLGHTERFGFKQKEDHVVWMATFTHCTNI